MIIGLVSNVPMQTSNLPPHARCAIISVDENPLEAHVFCLKGPTHQKLYGVGNYSFMLVSFCKAIYYKQDEGGNSRKKCYAPCIPIDYNPNLMYIVFIFKFTSWFLAKGFCNLTSYIENAVDEHKFACLCLDIF
jgi:hypothetical protein